MCDCEDETEEYNKYLRKLFNTELEIMEYLEAVEKGNFSSNLITEIDDYMKRTDRTKNRYMTTFKPVKSILKKPDPIEKNIIGAKFSEYSKFVRYVSTRDECTFNYYNGDTRAEFIFDYYNDKSSQKKQYGDEETPQKYRDKEQNRDEEHLQENPNPSLETTKVFSKSNLQQISKITTVNTLYRLLRDSSHTSHKNESPAEQSDASDSEIMMRTFDLDTDVECESKVVRINSVPEFSEGTAEEEFNSLLSLLNNFVEDYEKT